MLEYSRKAEEDEKCTADDDGEGYPATPDVPVAVAAIVTTKCQTGSLDRWFTEILPVVASKKDSHGGFWNVDRRVEWEREEGEEEEAGRSKWLRPHVNGAGTH